MVHSLDRRSETNCPVRIHGASATKQHPWTETSRTNAFPRSPWLDRIIARVCDRSRVARRVCGTGWRCSAGSIFNFAATVQPLIRTFHSDVRNRRLTISKSQLDIVFRLLRSLRSNHIFDARQTRRLTNAGAVKADQSAARGPAALFGSSKVASGGKGAMCPEPVSSSFPFPLRSLCANARPCLNCPW